VADVVEPQAVLRTKTVETCAIELWRGYTSATFVAIAGGTTPLYESRSFKHRGRNMPAAEGAARAAYDEVVAALELEGWARAEEPPAAWCNGQFTRTVLVTQVVQAPVHEPEPEPEPQVVVVAAAPPPPAPEPEPVAVAPPPPAPQPEPVAVAPPPPPVPAAPEPAPVAIAPRPRRRAKRLAIAVCILGLAVSCGTAAYDVLMKNGRTILTTHAADAAAPKRTHHVLAASVPQKPARVTHRRVVHAAAPKPRLVHLAVAAETRSSWLEIRRGSKTGKVLYAGELAAGGRVTFAAPRLYARFGAAGNVRIVVDGRPVVLMGTVGKLFSR
jgi:Domain of unknown function (DUF4115)